MRLINGTEGWMIRRVKGNIFEVFGFEHPLSDKEEKVKMLFRGGKIAQEFADAANDLLRRGAINV